MAKRHRSQNRRIDEIRQTTRSAGKNAPQMRPASSLGIRITDSIPAELSGAARPGSPAP
jgi:hypothetical protein